MLISGTVKSVLTALYLILTKLATARRNGQIGDRTRNENSDGLASVLKLVMPTACCGAILGKGGRTVKQFVEESGASISVLPQVCNLCCKAREIVWCLELRLSRYGQPYYLNLWRA